MIAFPVDWTERIDMSTAKRIVAVVIMIAFVVLGIALMIQRIGAVIGWENVGGGWWIIVLLTALILVTAFVIYGAVKNKLNR
jgi:uncharacterized membrane protein